MRGTKSQNIKMFTNSSTSSMTQVMSDSIAFMVANPDMSLLALQFDISYEPFLASDVVHNTGGAYATAAAARTAMNVALTALGSSEVQSCGVSPETGAVGGTWYYQIVSRTVARKRYFANGVWTENVKSLARQGEFNRQR